ncbi:MAG: GNAT family N-acetyltransferase [Proteobacteria bacterium]|nr:GNAT family N-acetyltransferase [Pseudomonadota bacterium]
MQILVEPDRRSWEDAARQSDFWPLQQDWDYGLAARWRRQNVLRLLATDAGNVCGALQLVGRRWLGFAELWLALRGPVLFDANESAADALLAKIPHGLTRLGVVAPEIAAAPANDASWHGRSRVYTGHSCAIVDLAAGDEARLRATLHPKWRNRLAAAERGGLRVETATQGKWIDWVVARYEDLHAAKGFEGPSRDFVAQIAGLKAPRATLAVVALDANEPVAGALFVRHGPDASYYVAATTDDGRKRNAANLVLWRGLLALKAAGVRKVDLGTIDTDRSPGLARFKLGTGATPRTLAGTYL